MSINKAIIKVSEKALLEILGSISDLPWDIANTVCNIYYTFFRLNSDCSIESLKNLLGGLDELLGDNSDNPSTIIRINIDSLEDTRKTGSPNSLIGAEFICINKMIQALRIFRDHPIFAKNKTPFLQTCDLILDIFKFRISRAFDKTPIRRNIERRLKQSGIDEIPNLVDLMEVCIDDEDDEY
jgi:hypothetical protein